MNTNINDFLFEANYSDRYLQHIEELSKDTSIYNSINAKLAKETLDGIHEVKRKNNFIMQCLITERKIKNSLNNLR